MQDCKNSKLEVRAFFVYYVFSLGAGITNTARTRMSTDDGCASYIDIFVPTGWQGERSEVVARYLGPWQHP